ncbi:hypothetical protein ALC56_03805 [Trachymyrmex septentrionalis]|uniref:Uncharacterized protein n=1 Tax=Trachymyrmex septentrionalis TaxID=34720 RepID=A0A151JZ10_9HYME|nr:hypothetical protein ALC56_03805 [Trachymyrmex septentrionalis]
MLPQLDPPARKKLSVQRLWMESGEEHRPRTNTYGCGMAGAAGAVVRSKELLGYTVWVVRFPVERADRRIHSSNSGVDRHLSEILPRILPTSRYRRRQPVLIVRSNKSAYERSDFVDDNGALDFSTHESKTVHTWPCPGTLCRGYLHHYWKNVFHFFPSCKIFLSVTWE